MSNRKRPQGWTKHPDRLACIGDSLTRNYTTQTKIHEFWPTVLAGLLREVGIYARAINAGSSGNHTGQMVVRKTAMTCGEDPRIAVIFGGVNDPGNASTTFAGTNWTGSDEIAIAGSDYTKFEFGEYVLAGGNRYLVTNYYVPNAAIKVTPNLVADIAAGTAVTHDTQYNILTMATHAIDNGADYVIVVGAHYLNFTSGAGDTLSVDYAAYAPVRAAQAAAVTSIAAARPSASVLFVDLHAYFKALIQAGTVAQGDDTAWHVAVSDQHLNATGQQYIANAIYDAMEAEGWIQELS